MSSSGLSSTLSTPPLSSDDDRASLKKTLKLKNGKLSFTTKGARRVSSAPPRGVTPELARDPSPPHEYVLADNPDIAVGFPSLIRAALHGNAESSSQSFLSCSDPVSAIAFQRTSPISVLRISSKALWMPYLVRS